MALGVAMPSNSKAPAATGGRGRGTLPSGIPKPDATGSPMGAGMTTQPISNPGTPSFSTAQGGASFQTNTAAGMPAASGVPSRVNIGGSNPGGMMQGVQGVQQTPRAGPIIPDPSITTSLDAAAGMQTNNADYYQQQMELINQMMAATNTGEIQDLMAQLTLMQSQGNNNQTQYTVAQQEAAQAQHNQYQGYHQQQVGFNEQGWQLDKQKIEQDRIVELQKIGLSAEQAYAQMAAERASGQLNYETGMATAGQQRDYGLGRALQWQDTSQRARRSDATARGATGSAGFGQQWKDIANEYGLETSNINKTYDIKATYETTAWKNLQDKLAKGKELTEKEWKILTDAANAEAGLGNQAADLQYLQTDAGLWNASVNESIQHGLGQTGFNYERDRIALQDQMRDIQYQIQMAQMNNPSSVIGLQMQWNQLNQQMMQAPLQSLPSIYSTAQAGLPAPWQPTGPAWQPPPGWGTAGGR